MMYVCNCCGAEFRSAELGWEHDDSEQEFDGLGFDPSRHDWDCPQCGESQSDDGEDEERPVSDEESHVG
jgi:rubredoxin